MPARTKQEVEQQSTRDRIWEAMDYGYGKKREALEQNYAKSYSAADRQLLSRGMQRSSYGAQTLANINQERDKALGDVWSEQIADYQNRLTDQEDKEWQRAFQERQLEQNQNQFELNLAENARQHDEGLAFQKEQAAVSRDQWQQQFDYGKQRDAVGDQQWQAQFDYGKQRDTVADQQWQAQFDYGKQRDTVADQQWQANFNYQAGRDAVSDEQWQRMFDADQSSEDRKYAADYAAQILANGQMPSAELLARAGLSEADARAMMAQLQAAGGSTGSRGNGGSGNDKNNNDGKERYTVTDDGLFKDANGDTVFTLHSMAYGQSRKPAMQAQAAEDERKKKVAALLKTKQILNQ